MHKTITALFLIAAGTLAATAEEILENTTRDDFNSTEEIKILAGTLKLTGDTIISHNVSITAGTLVNTGTLNLSGNLTVANGTTLTLNNANLTGMLALSGEEDSTATINFSGTENLIANATGNFNFSLANDAKLVFGESFAGTIKSLSLGNANALVEFCGNATLGTAETALELTTGTLKFSAGTTTFAKETNFSKVAITLAGGALAGEKLIAGAISVEGNSTLQNDLEAEFIFGETDGAILTVDTDKTLKIKNSPNDYTNVIVVEKGTLTINGAGKLVGDGEADQQKITFLAQKEGEGFVLGGDIDVSGQTLIVEENTKLTLDTSSEIKEISLAGTLSANRETTIEKLTVAGTGTALIDSPNKITVINSDGDVGEVELGSGAVLTIAEDSILEANIKSTKISSELAGAGTLKGDLTAEAGTISIAKIEGNVTSSGKVSLASNEIHITGTWTNADSGTLTIAENVRTITIDGGALENAGTLIINGATEIVNGLKNEGTLQINAGASLAGAVEFVAESRLLIDVSQMSVGTTFDALDNLEENSFANTSLWTTSGISLADRLVWRDGAWTFLGLNGRDVETTLFPDFLREQSLQTFNFAENVLAQFDSKSVRKPLFGKTRKTSKYMRGFLERERQFDRTENKPEIVPVSEENPGDYAKVAEKALSNAWLAGSFLTSTRKATGNNPEYDLTTMGTLLGTDIFLGNNWSVGLALGYSKQKMKTAGTSIEHELDSDFYQAMAFMRYDDRTGTDATFAILGGTSSTESTRGNANADFDSWQAGALMDFGLGFMPSATSLFRANFGLTTVYAHSDAIEEHGAGTLNVDADHAWTARASAGLTYAWLPIDALQITISGKMLYDFGSKQYSQNAYDIDTQSQINLQGREHKSFGLQLNAMADYAINERFSIFGGVSGTQRSDANELKLNAGARISF